MNFPDKIRIPISRRQATRPWGISIPGTPERLEALDQAWYDYKSRQEELADEGTMRNLAAAGMLDPEIAQYFMDDDSLRINDER